MPDEIRITFVDECPVFPARRTKRGQCKYPFDELDAAGRGFDVHNRTLSSVRHALTRWSKAHEGVQMTVREVDGINGKIIRVRRDK